MMAVALLPGVAVMRPPPWSEEAHGVRAAIAGGAHPTTMTRSRPLSPGLYQCAALQCGHECAMPH